MGAAFTTAPFSVSLVKTQKGGEAQGRRVADVPIQELTDARACYTLFFIGKLYGNPYLFDPYFVSPIS
jgi:hypothetical protein